MAVPLPGPIGGVFAEVGAGASANGKGLSWRRRSPSEPARSVEAGAAASAGVRGRGAQAGEGAVGPRSGAPGLWAAGGRWG